MAKEYNVGSRLYLPVLITAKETNIMMGPDKSTTITDAKFSYVYWHGKSSEGAVRYGEPGLLLSAKEVAEKELGEPGKDYILVGNNNFMTFPSKTLVVSEEETRIKTLTEKIATLTEERDGARKQADIFQEEIKKLTADRDKFAKTAKDKADLANKACTERDAAQGDLVTAKEAIGYLQEENKKLKQKLKDAEACYDVVADTSTKRKNRVTTMEEVIVALVEKIRGLEGGET